MSPIYCTSNLTTIVTPMAENKRREGGQQTIPISLPTPARPTSLTEPINVPPFIHTYYFMLFFKESRRKGVNKVEVASAACLIVTVY